ncbi:MAG: Haloacid dehalogenase, IB family protein [Candidatus Moranbacteria bacterium GW2011_GWE1_36_7]|nr:MAG: Haloacid dehalogenase, IB family protein [Candidatus Moranbacteria bacterium GW2011_GWD2_36_12]KKQ06113.1 MAG: Haloacid dehalogenase, IB family protein [Candidatus Moranbacteria bacterium GW2011_GWE2_36_40]KKQ12664.1 MAG: Haloacid dehalogenase, IB family protein [Candidatus Moranbacteria bacterium GW2011_GWE1_36_7]
MKEKQKIAIFDIDGTIFRKNLQFELINELSWMNIFPRKVRDQIVTLYTNWLEHKGTYEQYRAGLVELYEKYIRGCKLCDVQRASKMVVEFHQDRTYIFAEDVIKKLRSENYHLIAISGSPVEIVKEYNKSHLKFDAVFGSVY